MTRLLKVFSWFLKVLAKKDPERAATLLEIALRNQSDSSSYGRAVRNAAHFYEVQGNKTRAIELSKIASNFE